MCIIYYFNITNAWQEYSATSYVKNRSFIVQPPAGYDRFEIGEVPCLIMQVLLCVACPGHTCQVCQGQAEIKEQSTIQQ